MSVLQRSVTVWLAVLVVAGMSGCAALQPRPAEEVVKERSQERWNALVAWDLKKAYEYFSPGSRAILTQDTWASSLRSGFWKSAVVDRVACASAESCDAYVTIEYEYQGRRMKTPLRETWIKEGSNWWYVQK